jgi:hypothetical protein
MPNSESLGFRIVTVIVLTIIAGFVLAVIIYFNQIKQGKIVTTSEASSMLVIAGIIFAITIILWIWALIRLFFSKKDRDEYTVKAKTAVTQYTSQSGVSLTSAKPPTSYFTTGPAPAPITVTTSAPKVVPPPSIVHTLMSGPAPVNAVETTVPAIAPSLSSDSGGIPVSSSTISADVEL